MKTLVTACVILLTLQTVNAAAGGIAEEWDKDQTRAIQEIVLPLVARLPDGAAIRATFERALSLNPAAVPDLIILMEHANDDVSTSATELLGRIPDPRAAAALKRTLEQDPRSLMKATALTSLGRMRDPEAATLALAALRGSEDLCRGAGGLALGLIGDSANGPAILTYLDSMAASGIVDTGAFEVLAVLGDAPGSTAVRDRLVAEANKKSNAFEDRLEAAYALRKMGLERLVIRLLDRDDAQATIQRILTLKFIVRRAASEEGVALISQSALESVLAEVDSSSKDRKDRWGRPLRVRFVALGDFHIVSDGPDRTPGTPDDMSTAEPFPVYDKRVFADLF